METESAEATTGAAFLMVTTAVADREQGHALARALVDAKLAACVQILPIESVYRWDGAVETSSEHLLLCKISAVDYFLVETAIRERHTYDVPEIVALPITAGATSYLEWLTASTTAVR